LHQLLQKRHCTKKVTATKASRQPVIQKKRSSPNNLLNPIPKRTLKSMSKKVSPATATRQSCTRLPPCQPHHAPALQVQKEVRQQQTRQHKHVSMVEKAVAIASSHHRQWYGPLK
jgi:hypothetical protein